MTTLYYKSGRRYIPCHDTAAYDGLPDGKWLVIVQGGCRRIRALLDTRSADAALQAALAKFETDLGVAIVEASQAEPTSRPLSAKEQRAWRAYAKVMGEERPLTFTRPAAADIARRAIDRWAERVRSESAGRVVERLAQDAFCAARRTPENGHLLSKDSRSTYSKLTKNCTSPSSAIIFAAARIQRLSLINAGNGPIPA